LPSSLPRRPTGIRKICAVLRLRHPRLTSQSRCFANRALPGGIDEEISAPINGDLSPHDFCCARVWPERGQVPCGCTSASAPPRRFADPIFQRRRRFHFISTRVDRVIVRHIFKRILRKKACWLFVGQCDEVGGASPIGLQGTSMPRPRAEIPPAGSDGCVLRCGFLVAGQDRRDRRIRSQSVHSVIESAHTCPIDRRSQLNGLAHAARGFDNRRGGLDQ